MPYARAAVDSIRKCDHSVTKEKDIVTLSYTKEYISIIS